MVAGAISFNSGVLLFADTDLAAPRKTPRETRRIFHRPYGSSPAVAHSAFVVREPVAWAPAVFQRCERAVDTLGRIREAHDECGDSAEMVVVHADGHVSDVQRIVHDSREQRSVTLSRLSRSWAPQPATRPVAGVRRAATVPFSRL